MFILDKILKRKTLIGCGIAAAGILLLVVAYWLGFTAPQKNSDAEIFIVPLKTSQKEAIQILHDKGFIRQGWAFKIVWDLQGLDDRTIQPGGYKISKSDSPWKIAQTLAYKQSMKWVVVPEGWRKEQIAELLSQTFNWQPKSKSIWVNNLTARKFDYIEGVYFPDTYLIPVDETPIDISDRMRMRFNEKFAPYAKEALDQNIKWTTVLKLASIIQREAAGKDDMPLISGILWNRLQKNMKLEIDATVQYARDTKLAYENDPCEDPTSYARAKGSDLCYNPNMVQPTVAYLGMQDWWKPITPADKELDSYYNTYKYSGLPPHPIDNPGLDAVKAVLHPADTECLYYLHDSNRQIHCAKTYEEHQQNINQYLKN